ncbi:MAG: hypothetical protein OEX12_00075 [Gammaproteobacteria bacterium]|nr:hypothetical protein [Gammaproteobacteria bacterium]
MALTETRIPDRVITLEDGQIEIRYANRIFRNGNYVTTDYDVERIDVGEDVSGKEALVRDVVNGNVFTAERIAARQAVKDAEDRQ